MRGSGGETLAPDYRPLRILVVHNAYHYRGGEDTVVEAEIELLRVHGHEVEIYARHNDEIAELGVWQAAKDTLWSGRTFSDMAKWIKAFRPDLIHAHNTFPLISPSLYWAAARARIPTVQTLHNFRLLCPQATFLRAGRICEDCLGSLPWRGMTRRCYRGSLPQSGILAAMLGLHRTLGTYRGKVTRYIALNDFSRRLFVHGGLPAKRIRTKPNFVGMALPPEAPRQGILFVGRLSPEKGVATLAEAAGLAPEIELTIIGDGPEEARLDGLGNVHALGFHEPAAVRAAMCRASCLVLPSICYDNFPRTLVEAYACGLPVIASRLGSLPELVCEGETGLLFEPGNAGDLASKIRWAHEHPDALRRMGAAARAEYEAKYTPEKNYEILMGIYREAIAEVRGDVG